VIVPIFVTDVNYVFEIKKYEILRKWIGVCIWKVYLGFPKYFLNVPLMFIYTISFKSIKLYLAYPLHPLN